MIVTPVANYQSRREKLIAEDRIWGTRIDSSFEIYFIILFIMFSGLLSGFIFPIKMASGPHYIHTTQNT